MLCVQRIQGRSRGRIRVTRVEVAPHGIKVLIVEPGNFRTNFVSAVSPPPQPILMCAL